MSADIFPEQIDLRNEDRWNKLLFHSIYPSYRQSLSYEYSRQLSGRSVSTFLFVKDGIDIAGVHYSIKQSQFSLFKTADILSGFVFKSVPDKTLLEFLTDHFMAFAMSQKADYLRISPWLPKIVSGQETPYKPIINEVLSGKGFEIISDGRHTYWIDLTHSEEELFKKMKRQTRYDVKQGLKSDIKTTKYARPDFDLINKFWNQYHKIAKKKNFNLYPEEKFKNDILALTQAGIATLFVQKFKSNIINFSLASNFGIASYLHGAVDLRFKNHKDCPSPGHLAQWHMITEMKSRSVPIYDMGFCPGPVPAIGHPAYNIWRFKYGFGGYHVEFVDNYGLFLRPLKGKLFKLMRKFK